jgi:hypothetical protein
MVLSIFAVGGLGVGPSIGCTYSVPDLVVAATDAGPPSTDAGPPATVDSLLAGPDCLFGWRGPTTETGTPPALPSWCTQRALRFDRGRSAANVPLGNVEKVSDRGPWGAPSRLGTPPLAVAEAAPFYDLAVGTTEEAATWSLYAVVRARPHANESLHDHPLFSIGSPSGPVEVCLSFNANVGVDHGSLEIHAKGGTTALPLPTPSDDRPVLVSLRTDGFETRVDVVVTNVRFLASMPVSPTLPPLRSGSARLLADLAALQNLEGALSEVLLIGRGVDDDTHEGIMQDLARRHGFVIAP